MKITKIYSCLYNVNLISDWSNHRHNKYRIPFNTLNLTVSKNIWKKSTEFFDSLIYALVYC